MNTILKSIRKKSVICFFLFSLLTLYPKVTNVHACVYSPETEELRYMLFNPDLLGNKAWWTFFYNKKYLYLDGTTVSDDDETLLAKEWLEKSSVNVPIEEVRSSLFGRLSDSTLKSNSFYLAIQENSNLKSYFELAKKVELVTEAFSSWDESVAVVRERGRLFIETLDEVERAYSRQNDLFVKKRLAFQLVKMEYYLGDISSFNKYFNQWFKNVDQRSILDWWALHYKSMTLEKEHKVDSANYLHAVIFSRSSNKMLISKKMFSRERLDSILILARDDHERADIYALSEVINPGRSLNGLRALNANNPAHKHWPLLISREINKLEDWIGSDRFADPAPASTQNYERENLEKDLSYLHELTAFVKDMTAIKAAVPDFYNLALANLLLMANEGRQANIYLNKINTSSPEVRYQRDLLRVVSIAQTKDVKRDDVQNEIAKIFESLLRDRAGQFESQKILYSLCLYLRYSFANNGCIYLAALFDNYAINKFCYTCEPHSFEYSMISYLDKYAKAADIAKLIEIYNDQNKNDLEKALLKPYSNSNYLLDVLATKYLREGNIKRAKTTLDQIPDNFWLSFRNATYWLDTDPFLDVSEIYSLPTMRIYNKREIVARLEALEVEAEKVLAKRKVNYLLLGNAWYNFADNSWFMLSYRAGSQSDERAFQFAFRKAKQYYLKALSYEDAPDNKAKIIYMLARITSGVEKCRYANMYERYSQTEFYIHKNCLTLQDLAKGGYNN